MDLKRGKWLCEDDSEERSDGAKRTKFQDAEPLPRSKGVRTCSLGFSKNKKAPTILCPCNNKEEASQITLETVCTLSAGSHSCLEQDGACLSPDHTGGKMMSSANNHCDDPTRETKGSTENAKVVEKDEAHIMKSMALRSEPDAVDGSCLADQNASGCDCTSGPVEENEPLRKWNELEQTGFLSMSTGDITIPDTCGRRSMKRMDEEPKRKSGYVQKEPVNWLMKVGAPSGLLSGLNLGIINHVRNRKQVHSILEAMLREIGGGRVEETLAHGSTSNRFDLSTCKISASRSFEHRAEANDAHISEQNFPSPDGPSANPDYMTSLSLKAATVASLWLELIQEDIKGRLAALERSRKRVRNAIHAELPQLLSTEFLCNEDDRPSVAHNPTGSSEKVVPETHVARWRSLFSQMEESLNKAGRRLEIWLSQVQQMRLFCEKGIRYVGSYGLSSNFQLPVAFEGDCAVRAAAASIYSTCNLIANIQSALWGWGAGIELAGYNPHPNHICKEAVKKCFLATQRKWGLGIFGEK